MNGKQVGEADAWAARAYGQYGVPGEGKDGPDVRVSGGNAALGRKK